MKRCVVCGWPLRETELFPGQEKCGYCEDALDIFFRVQKRAGEAIQKGTPSLSANEERGMKVL